MINTLTPQTFAAQASALKLTGLGSTIYLLPSDCSSAYTDYLSALRHQATESFPQAADKYYAVFRTLLQRNHRMPAAGFFGKAIVSAVAANEREKALSFAKSAESSLSGLNPLYMTIKRYYDLSATQDERNLIGLSEHWLRSSLATLSFEPTQPFQQSPSTILNASFFENLDPLEILWVAELGEFSLRGNLETLIAQIPRSGELSFERENYLEQWELIEADIREVVASKRARNEPLKITVLQAGLGWNCFETRDVVQAIIKAIGKKDIRNWEINILGIDNEATVRNAEKIFESDFARRKHPFLHPKFAAADINNIKELRKAFRSMNVGNINADYIFHRNTSYPNCGINWQPEVFSLPFDQQPGLQNERIARILRLYLPYRNLLALAGKPTSCEGMRTRVVVEAAPRAYDQENHPYYPYAYIPPGLQPVGSFELGVMELFDLERVLNTGIADYKRLISMRNFGRPPATVAIDELTG
ncbi:MAG: hypothetical protein COX62_04070 [Deltaproteobacteria bacterium CG_4_10_14_0_2_um_filter_43_8]|nr:MAG: hypothetical protein COV43_01960 [Deltaproteobacteria bacterium CG11_big_fil_rev_8_21_14_0_20_42_23]PJA20783.1 MAG: hypothetical protein COX62_04070 [Deltaproteobacteria bacterium CG_4_10_14_0_2_um_filter_43_8]PJC63878.1 MAG: hypothetical protein CO021_07140 [Deltaproteobacteria bacterium CG_4_9_14_0_2_um_filter_42_21]